MTAGGMGLAFATKQECETIHVVADNESALNTLIRGCTDSSWCGSWHAVMFANRWKRTTGDGSSFTGARPTKACSGTSLWMRTPSKRGAY